MKSIKSITMKPTLPKLNRTLPCLLISMLTACGSPEQNFVITVTDEDGKPSGGIECFAGFNRNKTDGTGIAPYIVTGQTNAEGKLELSGETVFFDTSVRCRRDGYYDSVIEKLWITGKNGNRWEPSPVEVDLIMKKIRKPHPMYAVKPGTGMKFVFPKDAIQPVGFDLLEQDWIKPYGRGKHPDFLLWFQRKDPDAQGHFPEGIMQMAFSAPEDGIIPVFARAEGGSVLLSPTEAPTEGYDAKAEFSSHPQKDGIHPSLDIERRTWVFRVRTKVDTQGKIVSAVYGKIQGAPEVIFFSQGPAFRMTYYLNAMPNQRGLEWDQKNNLFSELPQKHWPRIP